MTEKRARAGHRSAVSGRKAGEGRAEPPRTDRGADGAVKRTAPRRARGEGSIRQRADGRYEGRIRLADGSRRSVYGAKPEAVARELRKLAGERDQGIATPPDRLTLGEFLTYWLDLNQAPVVRGGTARSYRLNVEKRIAPHLGSVRLQQLTAGHVERWLITLSHAGYAPSTANQARSILRMALNQAIRDRVLSYNAAELARPLPTPRTRKRAMSVEDGLRLLEAMEGWWLAPAVLLALTTGMRRGEVLGLRWGDIDADACEIHIRQQVARGEHGTEVTPVKTKGSEAVISVHPVAMALLVQYRQTAMPAPKAGPFRDLVFISPVTRGAVAPDSMSLTFRRRAERAGLGRWTPHDLRHGVASLLNLLGFNLRVIQEQLRHANVSTTANIYTHVGSAQQREAAQRLGDALLRLGGQSGVSTPDVPLLSGPEPLDLASEI